MEIIAGVATVLATVIAAVALWLQVKSHRRGPVLSDSDKMAASSSGVVVSVANSWPTWGDRIGDWHLTVKAYNGGVRPVTLEAWGFEVPGGGSVFQARSVPWSAGLPCRLEPGEAAEFHMPEAGLREALSERGLRFAQTKSLIRLASDEKVYGPAAPVADE